MVACKSYTYKRREPEKTTLYRAVEEHLQPFINARNQEGRSLPEHVVTEFRDFLRCGRLEHGFVINSCKDCGHHYPVGLSCKKRGFCPSCAGKRMNETTAHLIDNVLPHAPYRQYVVTVPPALRFWMGTNRNLARRIHKIVTSEIDRHYIQKAKELGVDDPQPGSISFTQLAGSAANFNYHWHILYIEGVYSNTNPEKPKFTKITDLANEDIEVILEKIVKRAIRVLRKRKLLTEDPEVLPDHKVDQLFEDNEVLAAAMHASVNGKIAFGERSGQKVRVLGKSFGYDTEIPLAKGYLCYSMNNFTVHAATAVRKDDRRRLEELVRYLSRPPIANSRLKRRADGLYTYKLKTPWRNGVTHILLSGEELLEKLAAIIPTPRAHLCKHSGVFSSHHSMRQKIILQPEIKKGFYKDEDTGEAKRYRWSKLLSRIFKIDVERCVKCGSKNTMISKAIFSPSSIERYLKDYATGVDPPKVVQTGLKLEPVYEACLD